jgi:hypothetical protein
MTVGPNRIPLRASAVLAKCVFRISVKGSRLSVEPPPRLQPLENQRAALNSRTECVPTINGSRHEVTRAIRPSIGVIESLYFAGPYRIPYHG